MRILIINSEYPPIGGGAGNASANLARCFASAGHEVAVLTARFHEFPAIETKDGVRVHRVPTLRQRMDRSGALEQLAFLVSASLVSSNLARQLQPDAILAFFGMPAGAVAWLLRRRFGIPYIVSLRGGDVPGFRPYDFRLYHRLIGPALRPIWREAAAVVANSEGLRELARHFEPRMEISVIPNGVDAGAFEVKQRSWAPARILSVGRVVRQKGLDIALEALAGLSELAWEWTIAGDGPLVGALIARANGLGLSGRVHFLGWQTREQLVTHYQQANLFLFPSRHEGMPNAVLEAMASGLPVVATRIAGSEELIEDGVSGRLVETEDVSELREGLRLLVGDPDLREEMGRAARKRVERDYSWENCAAEYLRILERIT